MRQRKLVNGFFYLRPVGSAAFGDEAGNQFDVEDPLRQERWLSDALERVVHSEEFCAALRVVNRHLEDLRSSEDASEIMPQRASLDGPTEQLDPRAEDHLNLRVGVKNLEKKRERVERRREVRVPVAREARIVTDRLAQPLPDGLGLAAVRGQHQELEPSWILIDERLKQVSRAVRTPIVHQDEQTVFPLLAKGREGQNREALRFVVARDDERSVGHGAERIGPSTASLLGAGIMARTAQLATNLGCPAIAGNW